MRIVHRLAKAKYKEDVSGYGASLYGGRWNPKGTPALYTSIHLSLSVLELIAQTRRPYIGREQTWVLTLRLPLGIELVELATESLPAGWDSPERSSATQELGAAHFRAGAFGIDVPSAVLPRERNVILNPRHEAFGTLEFVSCLPLKFDSDRVVHARPRT